VRREDTGRHDARWRALESIVHGVQDALETLEKHAHSRTAAVQLGQESLQKRGHIGSAMRKALSLFPSGQRRATRATGGQLEAKYLRRDTVVY